MIEKPMNPNADADFRKAIDEAKRQTPPRYSGKALIEWNGTHEDFINTLLANGYKVMSVASATPKYVYIEYSK